MGLSQAERCTLLLAGDSSVLGLALALLSSCPHLDDAISLPMPEKLPWQGKPKARLGIAVLAQPAEAAWRKERAPSASTAPKPLPDSAGWLMNTSTSKLQKVCPCFSLLS